jgi:hypothetical protein
MKKLIGAALAALLSATALVAFASSPASAAPVCDYTDPVVQYPCTLFQQFGGHTFTAGEASYWAGVGQSQGRRTEVTGMLFSPEMMSGVVDSFYGLFLGRDADPAGAQYWTEQLIAGRVSFEQLAGLLASSDEGFAALGGTNDGFVSALYGLFLDRAPEGDALTYWSGLIDQLGRFAASQMIARSAETAALYVEREYESYLGRPADPGAMAFWAPLAQEHGILALLVEIVISDEAFAIYSTSGLPARTGGAVASLVHAG